MDAYKKIFRSRKLRLLILRLFFWVPDKIMLRLQYKIKMGFWPNFKTPTLYSEKVQLYKMNYRNNIIRKLTDKELVKQWVKEKGYQDIIISNIDVLGSLNELDLGNYPSKFVIKTSNGAGGNNVLVVNDKNKVTKKSIKKFFKHMPKKTTKFDGGREWSYSNLKTKFVIEELIGDSKKNLKDYKFFCFNGKMEYFYVIGDRNIGQDFKGYMNIFDNNFNVTPYYRKGGFILPKNNYILPNNIKDMVFIAEKLSSEFPHVRVDLYNVEGKIYFGEMTFYNASGYVKYNLNFDEILGSKFTYY